MAGKQKVPGSILMRLPSKSVLAVSAIFAWFVLAAGCDDSGSPTAPDPLSSSSSSTVMSTTSSQSTSAPTSRTTSSVDNSTVCETPDLGYVSGTLTHEIILWDYCESPNTDRQAMFTYFSLTQSSDVTIDMTSSEFDTYLYLRQGISSRALHQDDDGGGGTNSRIVARLDAGTYVLEQASYDRLTTSFVTFTRTIRVRAKINS